MMNPFKTIKGIVTTRLPLFSGVLAFAIPTLSIVLDGTFGTAQVCGFILAAVIVQITRWGVSQSK